MTKQEIIALEKLHDYANELMSNRTCNDIDKDILAMFTTDELTKMDKEYHEWNGDPEEHEDRDYHSMTYDWIMHGYLFRKAIEELKGE